MLPLGMSGGESSGSERKRAHQNRRRRNGVERGNEVEREKTGLNVGGITEVSGSGDGGTG